MASFYSVIRFLPSALAEEFVNVGVISFGDGRIRSRFLNDWHRVERFAASDVSQARAFQAWVNRSIRAQEIPEEGLKLLDEATIRTLASEWTGTVQLSAPRASLQDPDTLLADVAPVFLVEPPNAERHKSDKPTVLQEARKSLKRAVKLRFSKAEHIAVKSRLTLSTIPRKRVFDLVVTNGAPRYAAQCFNFGATTSKTMLERVDALAFAVEDVRKRFRELPVAMVIAPPENQRAAEDFIGQARDTFETVGNVELIRAEEIARWSERVVTQVADEILANG